MRERPVAKYDMRTTRNEYRLPLRIGQTVRYSMLNWTCVSLFAILIAILRLLSTEAVQPHERLPSWTRATDHPQGIRR